MIGTVARIGRSGFVAGGTQVVVVTNEALISATAEVAFQTRVAVYTVMAIHVQPFSVFLEYTLLCVDFDNRTKRAVN